ncbi:Pycsar system effector family protein [uncultured Maritimibacter sp.]|jgi:hypothetical protein|uniref:Pycsar system effector family protein n=1 Tax=uncultured Maritimibacter sp. TaxID=991866 RepID=UPI0026225B68|nr:Pycsar system effector family protein [uncultured Maritimibacter sp.]
MRHIEELKWILERQLSWISAADAKATVVAPMPVTMLAISFYDLSDEFRHIEWVDLPMMLSIIGLFYVLLQLMNVLLPRLRGPEESNIFFGRISERNYESFSADMRVLTEERFKIDLERQIHINAEIASWKHHHMRLATTGLAFSVPVWLLSVAVGGGFGA